MRPDKVPCRGRQLHPGNPEPGVRVGQGLWWSKRGNPGVSQEDSGAHSAFVAWIQEDPDELVGFRGAMGHVDADSVWPDFFL